MHITIDPTAAMPSDTELHAAQARADAGEIIKLRMPSHTAYAAMAARLPQIANRVMSIRG